MKENLVGKKYGYLTVIEYAGKTKKYESLWLCKCDCGNSKITRGNRLKAGTCMSCGCYQKKQVSKSATKHGYSKTKLYKLWAGILQRCENSKSLNFNNYGYRGISVCDEWHDFLTFREWAYKNGYSESERLTIDRIDSDGNYEPSNCRWVSYSVQENNKRNNHFVTIDGITKTISEWCSIYKINESTVRSRLFYGWDDVTAITTKPNQKYNWRIKNDKNQRSGR